MYDSDNIICIKFFHTNLYLKNGKRLNPDSLIIKKILKKGYRQCEMARILKIKKEKVSYWSRHELRTTQENKKKLKDIYINDIKRWANNKTTSAMSSSKIACKINSVLKKRNEFNKNGKPLSVHFTTVNNYLKETILEDREK